MQTGILLATVLPLSLFIIMFGMGLSLTLRDFARIAIYPKAIIVGLFAQLLLLPIIGFSIATLFRLEPELAVGLVVLSCCPSGPTSNMYSYLFKGDVALSVTLTAVISVIKPFTLPILTYYAMVHFLGEGKTIDLPIARTILQLFVITVLPVGIGMLVKHYFPKLAKHSDKPIKVISMLILFIIIAGLIRQNWDKMLGFFFQSGVASFTMNCVCIGLGYILGLLFKLSKTQAITIAFELGIQNGTTALLITGTLLMVPAMTIVPITYSLLMFFTAFIFGVVIHRKNKNSNEPQTLQSIV